MGVVEKRSREAKVQKLERAGAMEISGLGAFLAIGSSQAAR